MSGVYFARHGWAGSALLGAAFLLALGHAGPGVRACKVSLKVEKHAPSGEPGLLGSGEAALPVWGRGDLYRAPGLFFSLESRWWRRAPRAARRALRVWVLIPAQARTAPHGEDWTRNPAGLAAGPRRVRNVTPRPAAGAQLSLA